MSLNPAQRAAVEHIDGPLLVLAGAGSGKTRVVTEKLAWLTDRGFSPDQLLAITFTNKAAREMRERAQSRLRDNAEALTICTFHALGLRLLQAQPRMAGLRPGFSVLDADESVKTIKALAPPNLDNEGLYLLRQAVGQLKNEARSPEQALELAASGRERQIARLYADYQKRLSAWNAVDFDDLLRLPLQMLETEEEARRRWQARYRYLMVDEYQDTNGAQYRLLKSLAGERGAFTVVGDDDQSIYAWRGADPENLHRLGQDYPALRIVKLEQNYRCAARILRAANAVIGNNDRPHPKTLWSDLPEGPPIRVLNCRDDEHEAQKIAAEMVAHRERSRCRWADCALLYRGKHQARALEQALRLAQVPYVVAGGDSLFDHAEVKDALAYLRLVANPDDDGAFLRVVNTPRREIGATTLDRLGEEAARLHLSLAQTAGQDSVLAKLPARAGSALAAFDQQLAAWRQRGSRLGADELLGEILEATGYAQHLTATSKGVDQVQRRQRNLDALRQVLAALSAQRRTGLAELTQLVAILSDRDDDDRDAVRLTTVHAAKGLEFHHVAVVGMEDGIFPHATSLDEGRLDEERRLFYVAVTRARQTLTLSYSEKRRRYGSIEACTPSRFLDEMPAKELHWEGRDPDRDIAHSKELASSHFARMAALLGKPS